MDPLITAVHALRYEFPRVRLLIAGEGPLRPGLEAHVAALDLSRSVRFLGFVDDVGSVLGEASCYVLPSRAEGMPISLLEAMALSVHSVATAVGSIPTMVVNGEEALLVEPDDLTGLTRELRRILGHEELRKHIGQQARARFVRDFTADRTAATYQEFYRSLVQRTP